MSITDSARKVWREGLAPLMPAAGLCALARALRDDDPALLQGATCLPPPIDSMASYPVEAACAITYCGWKGCNKDSVSEAEEFFYKSCCDCDKTLGELAAYCHFINWFDECERGEMRSELLPLVEAEIESRLEEAGL